MLTSTTSPHGRDISHLIVHVNPTRVENLPYLRRQRCRHSLSSGETKRGIEGSVGFPSIPMNMCGFLDDS